jgi:molybdopterin molybdotransferase
MISFDEASQLIFDNIRPLGKANYPIESAIGCTLYNNIISDINVVPYRNSAMDGFAVQSAWLAECSTENQFTLPYDKTIFAGDPRPDQIDNSRPVKIMTGAMVPHSYDAVVKVEDVWFDDNSVRFSSPAKAGQNIREVGEDIRSGQVIFPKGHTLRSLDIGLLASIGLSSVNVFEKPSVLVAATGDELVNPGEALPYGKIYNSNRYSVKSMISPFCRSVESHSHIADRLGNLRDIFNNRHDIIITTGGVSMGDRDLVVKTAETTGWTTIFHKTKIKPGKPVYFAKRDRQLLFGLPGNPLSTVVTCAIYVIPALKKLSGCKKYKSEFTPVTLKASSLRKSSRPLIWPGTFVRDGDKITAEFSEKKSSSSLSAVMNSDGLIFQPETKNPATEFVAAKAIAWNQIFNNL